MLKKALLLSVFIFTIHICGAQTTFLPLGSEDYHVLDRIETISGRLCDTICNGDKPESRRNAICVLENLRKRLDDTGTQDAPFRARFNGVDRYNIDQMISESSEWT